MRLRNPPNVALLGWIREQANPVPRRLWPRRRVPMQVLRCHPDLCDRLEAIAEGLDARLRYLAGLPVLVHPNHVIFAVAAGTSWISLRLPPSAHSSVIRSTWGRRGLEGEWIDVDPWLTDLVSRDGVRRLQGWCRASSAYSGTLAASRRPATPRA